MDQPTHSLRADFVRNTDRRMLMAVRGIVVAASNPKVPLNVEGLAEATGLAPEFVHEMLASPEYRQLLQDTCKQRVQTLMQKGITVLDDLMGHEDPNVKLQAISKMTTLYTALNKDAVHYDTAGKADAETLLKKLEALQAVRRIEVTPTPTTNG